LTVYKFISTNLARVFMRTSRIEDNVRQKVTATGKRFELTCHNDNSLLQTLTRA